MDAQLANFIRLVNAGEESPPVHLLTASGSYYGTPVPQEEFWERSAPAFRSALADEAEVAAAVAEIPPEYQGLPFDQAVRLAAERQTPSTEVEVTYENPFQPQSGEQDVSGLVLWDAIWFPSQGDGLRLPVVRVPAAAVTSWWFAEGKPQKAGTRWSMGFGLGAIGDF